MSDNKICPVMSYQRAFADRYERGGEVLCRKDGCAQWVSYPGDTEPKGRCSRVDQAMTLSEMLNTGIVINR